MLDIVTPTVSAPKRFAYLRWWPNPNGICDVPINNGQGRSPVNTRQGC